MSFVREPLLFQPVYKSYLWGGGRLAEIYGRQGVPEVCAESWEICARGDEGESVVCSGRFAGRTLTSLCGEFGSALTGSAVSSPHEFPLLFKLIDAHRTLSVQVHPNEESARRSGGDPKTEAWVVLSCAGEASLYAGLKDGVTPESLRAALESRSVGTLLREMVVRPDQALFIPGGMVHAIGAGCLLYEVQQNSNTTYRLFDWNRVDKSGRSRELHVERGLLAIDWSLSAPELRSAASTNDGGNHVRSLVDSPCFHIDLLNLYAPYSLELDGATFNAIFVRDGELEVSSGDVRYELRQGESALIPADAGNCALIPSPAARVLSTRLV